VMSSISQNVLAAALGQGQSAGWQLVSPDGLGQQLCSPPLPPSEIELRKWAFAQTNAASSAADRIQEAKAILAFMTRG
jgi:hypothetical protein